MKVTVVFDFPKLIEPDCELATNYVELITGDTKVWAIEYSSPEGGKCDVYVEDAA